MKRTHYPQVREDGDVIDEIRSIATSLKSDASTLFRLSAREVLAMDSIEVSDIETIANDNYKVAKRKFPSVEEDGLIVEMFNAKASSLGISKTLLVRYIVRYAIRKFKPLKKPAK